MPKLILTIDLRSTDKHSAHEALRKAAWNALLEINRAGLPASSEPLDLNCIIMGEPLPGCVKSAKLTTIMETSE